MKNLVESKFKAQDWISPSMIKVVFDYWFSDHDHVRSPFPERIRENLSLQATNSFLDWSDTLSPEMKKEVTDQIITEKFEEIIFEKALTMVDTEDEKLTIRYPFMPRVGDLIQDKEKQKPESKIISREQRRKGDESFMKIRLRNFISGEDWETEFELPE